MLPATHRLRDADDFRGAVRRGTKSASGTVVVHLLVPAERSEREPLVGFVVSKRVGTAVVRNRVKRRLRHIFRQRIDVLPAGSVIVVRATGRAAAASSARLAADVDRVLIRLRAGAR